ncbi:unnamed protein product [Agarophyton chilense]|eukprot:gb/GEZJ01000385.1/.p2 GENE.gb/GEZJ01000385.1/~~gb/GEZJ01000385.1/.p2  ORF type:complete len:561 (+),score=123.28 gb/GEZJ01000385.1/:11879-13561(+)
MAALNDALSDADTQEPVKTELKSREVPESDDEEIVMIRVKGNDKDSEKKPAQRKAAVKGSRIVEPITDSDHSDDEQQSEPAVDFGEEEEEEVGNAPVKSGVENSEHLEDSDFMEIEDEGKGGDKPSNADQQAGNETQSKKKEPDSSQASKRTKRGKAKELSPSKTIKKSKLDLKAKPKAVKGKSGVAKKTTLVGKTKEKASTNTKLSLSEPQKSSIKEEKLPKKLSKGKPLVRKSVKPSPKAEKSSTKQKPLKPKKAIDKDEGAKEKKSPSKKNVKSTTPITTYSKKAQKSSGKASKAPVEQKKKSSGPVSTPKKTIGSKVLKKVKVAKKKKDKGKAESEDSGQEEPESDSEGQASDSESMADELAKTPASKLSILGNLACSSRDQNAEALLDHAVQQLGRYNIISYNAESNAVLTAYIIGNGTKRGWGLLQALVSGIPLVSDSWLSGSISEGKWLPLDAFRSDKFGQSPRSVDGTADGSGKLLDGLRIRVASDEKDASSIRKIVRLCGARLAQTRVDLVINDTKRKVENTCPQVQKKWLADSIEAGVPLEYDAYLVRQG